MERSTIWTSYLFIPRTVFCMSLRSMSAPSFIEGLNIEECYPWLYSPSLLVFHYYFCTIQDIILSFTSYIWLWFLKRTYGCDLRKYMAVCMNIIWENWKVRLRQRILGPETSIFAWKISIVSRPNHSRPNIRWPKHLAVIFINHSISSSVTSH